ncbi:MAG: hypothetical protein ACM3JB_10880 [Acidobacteriaceae bacterium]
MGGRGYFALGPPLAVALISALFGNKETSVEIAGGVYTVRPLRLAFYFVIIDVVLFLLMWAVVMITV